MNKATRFFMLERRYQNAKKRAERHLNKAARELEIMQTAFDEQKKILREMDIDEVPCDP